MRRKYLGFAIAAIATLGPAQAWGGDREIAEEIIERLKAKRDSGALKDFTLDMKVDQGVVLFRGSVSEARRSNWCSRRPTASTASPAWWTKSRSPAGRKRPPKR
jgi:hypothetical protein